MPPKRRREADDGGEQNELFDWDSLVKNLVEAMTNFVHAIVRETQRSIVQSERNVVTERQGDGVERVCYRCKQTGHLKAECPWSRPSFGVCFKCGQPYHRKKYCPKKGGAPVGGVGSGQGLTRPSVSQFGVQLGEL
ncbi:uncharacterized protein LOC132309216 [Cornus florida]|uniref:uncharacterized protein LOC132309216 n=1 Tax=Cornus florida TaxID=4283 RepID=UPI0028A09D53|nr:uncharacterized protein LOC132309216 [Cornus florida]